MSTTNKWEHAGFRCYVHRMTTDAATKRQRETDYVTGSSGFGFARHVWRGTVAIPEPFRVRLAPLMTKFERTVFDWKQLGHLTVAYHGIRDVCMTMTEIHATALAALQGMNLRALESAKLLGGLDPMAVLGLKPFWLVDDVDLEVE